MKVSNYFRLRNLFCIFCQILILLSLASAGFSQETNPSINGIINEENNSDEKTSVLKKFENPGVKLNGEPQIDFELDLKKSQKFIPPRYFVEEETEKKTEKIEEVRESRRQREFGWRIPRGAIEYGGEFGFAPNIALWMSGPKPWDISGHKQLVASVRWGRILGTKGLVTFSYAFEVAPISLAIGNEVVNKNFTPGSTTEPPTKRETTYGFHINPASFRFIFFPKYRLRPFLGSGIGPAFHLKTVPIPAGSKWNLMIDMQGGLQYMLSETRAIQFGYRYYHLSNMYLSDYNPGYNTNVYFFGYSIFKK